MELPDELWATVHELRPIHPCAAMITGFMRRIGYNDEDGMWCCLNDYKAEPDYFDSRHDGKRGCMEAFYGWGDECSDPRLHGGRR